MQVILWCFAVVGFIVLTSMVGFFYFKISQNTKDPNEMDEHEYRTWHASVKCGRSYYK